MRSILKLKLPFSSKKLGIADTAKVIQDKIMNITQVVIEPLPRMMSRSLAQSLASATVLPELSASIRSRPVRWSSSDPVSEAWPSILKPIMSVSSFSAMTGTLTLMQRNPRRRHCHKNWCYRRRPYRRGDVRESLRCLGKPH